MSEVSFASVHRAAALIALASVTLPARPVAAQNAEPSVIPAQWVAPWHRQGPRSTPTRPAPSGRFRTVCVRLCDGFFFPISFSARRSQFSVDARLCQARCATNGRLFIYRNPGQRIRHAVDLRGNRYADLENAFRYQTELVDGCECQPALATDAAQPPPAQSPPPPIMRPEEP